MEVGKIVNELNKYYKEALELEPEEGFKRGDKTKIFINILKVLFAKYGEGYRDISSFKSEIIREKQKMKNGIITYPIIQIPPVEIVPRVPREGDGEKFLDWEIKEFGLNSNSYY